MKVVHCKKEPFDVYIGRPGPWGNRKKRGVGRSCRADHVTVMDGASRPDAWVAV